MREKGQIYQIKAQNANNWSVCTPQHNNSANNRVKKSEIPAPKPLVFQYTHFINTSKIFFHVIFKDHSRNYVRSLLQSCCNSDPVSKALWTSVIIIWTPQCYFAKYLKGKAFKMLCNLTQRGFPEILFLKSFIFLFKSKPDLAYQFPASAEVCYLEVNSLSYSRARFSSSCFPQCKQY